MKLAQWTIIWLTRSSSTGSSIARLLFPSRRRLRLDPSKNFYLPCEQGKQARSAVRIKNSSKSHVAFKEEDYDNGYLVQPVGRTEPQRGGSDMVPGDEDEDPEIEQDIEEEEEDLDGEIQELPPSSSQKRKRNEDSHDDDDDDDDDDDCEDENDDVLPCSKSSKHH